VLKDLITVKENLPILPIVNASTLADLSLTDELINQLMLALNGKGYQVGRYTSSFKRGEQCVIFPNQYFALIGTLVDFAVELEKYISIFNELRSKSKNLLGTAKQIRVYLQKDRKSASFFETDEDIRLFSEFICKENCDNRLGAKRLINDKGKARSARDCFGSVILKCVGLADVSSNIFGQLTYELISNNRPELTSLKSLATQTHGGVLVAEPKIGEFVYKTINYLIKNNYATRLFEYLVVKSELHGSANIELEELRLTSIFKVSKELLSTELLSSGGKRRWFFQPFEYGMANYYLSTEWTVGKDSRLDLVSLASIFNHIYSNFEILITEEAYQLLDKNSGSIHTGFSDAKNEICYGAPGVGKSYSIDKQVVKSKMIRTVFHPDTQNSDFIGCLKPCMDDSVPPKILYKFRPGPFVNALIKATNNPSEHHWLVIEEINRAPAAAVFGDVFLLLDRNPVSGASELEVKIGDLDMLHYINQQTNNSYAGGELRIPGNLSLLATMNSSDQAVMPMDTAFKRRWQFKYMPLDLSVGSPCASGYLAIPSKNGELEVEWRIFATVVNILLTNEHIPEDKHLGPFFLSNEELREDNKESALSGKLFVYLWDDVLRHGRQNVLFDSSIKTFGQLNAFFSQKKPIFSDEFYSLIEKHFVGDENSSDIEDNF
jgi:hypothetical protein